MTEPTYTLDAIGEALHSDATATKDASAHAGGTGFSTREAAEIGMDALRLAITGKSKRSTSQICDWFQNRETDNPKNLSYSDNLIIEIARYQISLSDMYCIIASRSDLIRLLDYKDLSKLNEAGELLGQKPIIEVK